MYQNSVQHRIERADEYEVFFFSSEFIFQYVCRSQKSTRKNDLKHNELHHEKNKTKQNEKQLGRSLLGFAFTVSFFFLFFLPEQVG